MYLFIFIYTIILNSVKSFIVSLRIVLWSKYIEILRHLFENYINL